MMVPSRTVSQILLAAGLFCVAWLMPAGAAGIDTVRSPVFHRSSARDMSGTLGYIVDPHIKVTITPAGGTFNVQPSVTFSAPQGIDVYYTFDPIIPPEWFSQYASPVVVPAGMNAIRYFGKDGSGRMSAILKQAFTVDTAVPKIHLRVSDGSDADTLRLVIRKPATLHYTLDGSEPTNEGPGYRFDRPDQPPVQIVVPHQGRAVFKALAWDDVGNQSDPVVWERQYDVTGPGVSLSPTGGLYNKTFRVMISSTVPARIFYTLDSTQPDERSQLYLTEGVSISREGTTFLRCRAKDESGRWSPEVSARYVVDFKVPRVHSRVLQGSQDGYSSVELWTDEPATIYYEIGGARPTVNSPVYGAPFSVRNDQVYSYYATDMYGNTGRVVVVDELKKPKVVAAPNGGIFNTKVAVDFKASVPGVIFWRLFPDSVFSEYHGSVSIDQEGTHTIEYYVRMLDGTQSPFRRSLFITDWTPPRVSVEIEGKDADSLHLIFRSSKNVTVFYSYDGSDPGSGRHTGVAGNKLFSSWGRATVPRAEGVKISFYAEDLAGNRSAEKTIDLSRPQTIADLPWGADHVYNKILSVMLATTGAATIHYSRHGKPATAESPVFTTPINLTASDTIIAMAIDASGLSGNQDTFIYRIDLPPSADFSVSPDTPYAGSPVSFDASSTIDRENQLARLTFRWSFDGPGPVKGSASGNPIATHLFTSPGRYPVTLEVTDAGGNVSTSRRSIVVRDRCPEGMVSIVENDGRTVCIDRYEFPNTPGKLPRTQVSWVEAKIACIDAGKRLCSQSEWEAACRSGSELPVAYPYGNAYEKDRCPTELQKPARSGAFNRCSRSGVHDMIGNVWEWVEDKQQEYPLMMGGSYRDGKDAHCGLAVPGTMASRAEDVGFRCCK